MEEIEPIDGRLHKWFSAVRTGSISIRKHVVVQPVETEPVDIAEEELGPGIEPNYERFLPPSLNSTYENVARHPDYLRVCFADILLTVADAYDSLDHKYGPEVSGSVLQNDCMAVRSLARSFDIHPAPKD